MNAAVSAVDDDAVLNAVVSAFEVITIDDDDDAITLAPVLDDRAPAITDAITAAAVAPIAKKRGTKVAIANAPIANSAPAVSVEECSICCEPYNKSSHAPIDCEFVACKNTVCIACIRSYLLTTTNDPHCMECKQPWTPKFTLALKKNWMNNVYRPHREKFLCDVEISKIGEIMTHAEKYKKELDIQIELETKKNKPNEKIKEIDNSINKLRVEIENLEKKKEKYKKEISSIDRKKEESVYRGTHYLTGKELVATEKKVFFMSCPSPACNGMLSTQYKCGICEHFTCPDCHEVIGMNKTATAHICDPNNVASAEAVKKETKQCPGCHNRIYRTEGCSQMWCTGCHTTFDWNTGRKVVNERLHNPHWAEYQRGINNGHAPRAPGDVVCGGVCTRNDLKGITEKFGPLPMVREFPLPENVHIVDSIHRIHRIVESITTNEIRILRERCQTVVDFHGPKVQYVVGEISKEKLSDIIFTADKARQKNTEVLHIYELMSAVGIDMFNRLLRSELTNKEFSELVKQQIDEYNKLRMHCNGLFAVISNTYNYKVPYVEEHVWTIRHKLFNSKTMLTAGTDTVFEKKKKRGAEIV